MSKKQKKMLIRILVTAVMLAALHFLPVTGWLRLVLFLAAYLIIGYDILKKGRAGHRQRAGVRRELPDGGGHGGRVRAGYL